MDYCLFATQSININNSHKIHKMKKMCFISSENQPVHEISNNVVCATCKTSDQPVHMPAHMRSLIRDFACCLNILGVLSY